MRLLKNCKNLVFAAIQCGKVQRLQSIPCKGKLCLLRGSEQFGGGVSLLDKLDELYKTYGYCLNTLHSYGFDGSAGFAKMQSIMQAFQGNIKEFGGKKVVKLLDYAPGLDGLPKSDVLKFLLEDNCSIVVRPSGTDPKLKTYISVSAANKETAEAVEPEICKSAEKYLGKKAFMPRIGKRGRQYLSRPVLAAKCQRPARNVNSTSQAGR